MPTQEDRWFRTMHRFRQLNLAEALRLIPQGEMMVLKTIKEIEKEQGEQGCSVSGIARRLTISPPAVSRSVRHLREKGYLEAVTVERDRRGGYLKITPLGHEAMAQDLARIKAFMQRAVAHLEPGELDEFYRIFQKLYQGFCEEMERVRQEQGLDERMRPGPGHGVRRAGLERHGRG
ncbi:MarR family transcriptional regulator [Christensenellaceae bacterium NSJ-44]|uniref:MarR family transcriptional regulator n=1 Tax=Luoshenia tenuis TaxID=2763654 RepID=A0A926D2H3_9FIRM|nr:MarR family transcriptional regulator [Luoshenia tenuis]MBC8529739.1 MarR family transcriptional regulator [Luoshenia tenuis]